MIPAFDTVLEVVGTDMGGGSFTIEPYQHWLTADAVGSPPLPTGLAHPLYAWYASQGGARYSFEELFDLLQARAEDGVMLGETTIQWHRPVAVGATYRVRGEITDVTRKSGRRAGTFDVLTFQLDLLDDDGDVVAVVRNSMIFPRRDQPE